jgi:cytochrome P450 PksS
MADAASQPNRESERMVTTLEGQAAGPELIRLITRAFMHDPYPRLEDLRETASAVPIENNGMRMWVVAGYSDARSVLADQKMKKDLYAERKTILEKTEVRPGRRPRLPRELRRNLLDRDGSDHERLRALIGGTFGTAAARAMAPKIERLAGRLVDALPAGTPIDLLTAYARPLSMTIVADELGIPEGERRQFPILENDILTSPDIPRIEEAGQAIVDFARAQLERKLRHPADDLMTRITRARADGLVDDDEAVSTVTVLLTAGMEPASALGNGVFTLLRHPAELARLLADPALLPGCVEEILRYESPFRMLTPRFCDEPVQIGGTRVPAHELILVSAAAVNRDPGQFADPDRFDITRDCTGHLSFGRGAHRCLGAHLGRLQLSIALSALLGRFPGIRLADPEDAGLWRTGMFMRRLDTLSVVLGP